MQDRLLGAVTYFGSAVLCGILAAAATSANPAREPRYEFVQLDTERCLADTAAGTLVATDNVPVCLPTSGALRVAAR